MKRSRAFSLVEMLTCVSIVAVVAAIATPVFVSAKKSAKITASLSNLHQMYIALKIYQSDCNGDGRYGSLTEMGLPDIPYIYRSTFGIPVSVWTSPCGQNPSWEEKPIVIQYDYLPVTGFDNFESIAPIYKENLVMFTDLNCAEHGEPLYSSYVPHLGLGVLLSGALQRLCKPGDPRLQKWWAAPQN